MNSGANEASLERSYFVASPLDVDAAAALLIEFGQIMDGLGVVFFLRQGTCLGAVRDGAIIPWDDDLDLGSVVGLHGVTGDETEMVASAFRDNGFFVRTREGTHSTDMTMMKSHIRVDWTCYRIISDHIVHHPAMRIPAHLFADLKEIDFVGATFFVPDPPEEYLRCKYGPEWRTPKKTGFEEDVLALVSDDRSLATDGGMAGIARRIVLRAVGGKLRVLDHEGRPVPGAEVRVAGVGSFVTNSRGYARLCLPHDDWYALIIKYDGDEELLYQERLSRGKTYTYRSDPLVSSGRLSILEAE